MLRVNLDSQVISGLRKKQVLHSLHVCKCTLWLLHMWNEPQVCPEVKVAATVMESPQVIPSETVTAQPLCKEGMFACKAQLY